MADSIPPAEPRSQTGTAEPGTAESGERPARLVFGEVADDYDELRPSYPPEVFARLVRPGSRVLEVGAGTGKATAALLAAGALVDAVEPSQPMADRLAANLGPGQLRIIVGNIEELAFDQQGAGDNAGPVARGYDVVFAAQAWHWVEPVQATAVAWDALAPGGLLGLCWNHPLPLPTELRRRLDAVYDRCAPALTVRDLGAKGRDITDPTSPHGAALAARFGKPDVWEQSWSAHYRAEDFANLLGTQSDHRLLPATTREALLGGIAEALGPLGGIEVGYVTRLVTACRPE